jgi:hypothetical protein
MSCERSYWYVQKAHDVPNKSSTGTTRTAFYWEQLPQTRISTLAHSTPSAHNLQSHKQTAKRIQATHPSNYRIMFMRYLSLAILASTALSQSAPRSTNSNEVALVISGFDWDIEPEDGYPSIAFDDANEESVVILQLHRNAQR